MPFKKISGNKYQGPSGKTFNLKQVKLAYATNNFQKDLIRKREPKKK